LHIDHAGGTGGNTLGVYKNSVAGKGNIYAESTGSFGGAVLAGAMYNTGTNGIAEFSNSVLTGFTLAASATKNIYFGVGAVLIIIHFNGAGPGALCFTTWTGATVTELSDPNSYVEITDTGTKLAVYKAGDGNYFTLKNRSSGTYTLNITLLGARQS